jgi:hypothetical protein
MGDARFPRNLPESRAGDESMEDGFEEIAPSQPIARGEGLRTEVSAAVMTDVPLNPLGLLVAKEEALLLEAPML